MADTAARTRSILSPDSVGWHKIAYSDWGPGDGPLVICVHYLTGNRHYFDPLARTLAARGHRVIAPDMPGRGESDFLKNPADYNLRQYMIDLSALLSSLGVNAARSVDWIGASMGGFLGIVTAAMANTPVRRLALVDIGPYLAAPELRQIAAAIGQQPIFTNMDEATDYIRQSRTASWGPVPDGYWTEFAKHGIRALSGGKLTLHYDPALAVSFAQNSGDNIDLWTVWDAITCPVLTLRGENSTILTAPVADEMTRRGPRTRLEVFEGCGHVPSLAMPVQTDLIANWLKE